MPEAFDPARADDYYSLARTALLEITRDDTIGEPFEIVDEGEGVSTVRFANTLPGYPGWLWTVSIAELDGEAPNVLETELLPTGEALLAPDWVPWVERLAEYEASQEASSHAGDDSDDDESDDDDSDDDESDDDDSDDPDESGDDDDDFDDDESDDEEDDDEDDADDDEEEDADDLAPRVEFDGIDVEEAAEAAGFDSATPSGASEEE